MSLDDALGPHGDGALTLIVIASQELRFRALNAPFQAILADLGGEHLQILEAVGRARIRGMSTTELAALFADGTVKRLHNALDTLLSYNLVVKRMMIVARPAMRRMNIIHLPRFALEFTPHMFDTSAEFESDDACKKILCAAAEAYLLKLPSRSCVLTDFGRDLNLHKRQLEILRSHILQEAKKDDAYRLELFQAVLRPTKKLRWSPRFSIASGTSPRPPVR
uniref:B-block binding subunit of TFIIIC domain-containing protein n=1 Tax=Globisporangium ultimum (strain ATCC 200006 / CBS 805.95 / DAOM BR144) TaxID=431595 RepID=K3X2B1_GLOUD